MNTFDDHDAETSTNTMGRSLCDSFNKLRVRRDSKSCYYEDHILAPTKYFLLENDEVDPRIPSKFDDIIQRLRKFLQDVPRHIRRSKRCVQDFYKLLLYLQDYLRRYIEVFKRYPLTQDLISLLSEYVELEYEALYLANCYSCEYQEQVQNRILTYLLMFLYGSNEKKGTNVVDGSAINALYVIKKVKADYKTEHNLIEYLMSQLLKKLNVLDKVNEIKNKEINLTDAENWLQAPRLQEISRQLQYINDLSESDDEIQEIDIPRPMQVKPEEVEEKVDTSQYQCLNVKANVRSESVRVYSNNSDKCKCGKYKCSRYCSNRTIIYISDDDNNSDVELAEETPVPVIDVEDDNYTWNEEEVLSKPFLNGECLSEIKGNITENNDSTKAQTQNLPENKDVTIEKSVQAKEEVYAPPLEQNLNNEIVVCISDGEDSDVENRSSKVVDFDNSQKPKSFESVKSLQKNVESENIITLVQDQNKCLDNVSANKIHCAVNDAQTAEKPILDETLSDDKDSGNVVESTNDLIQCVDVREDISDSVNIDSTQSKSTIELEDQEAYISKRIIDQLECAIQCTGTFKANNIENNNSSDVLASLMEYEVTKSKQLGEVSHDLVQEKILASDEVVIQEEAVTVAEQALQEETIEPDAIKTAQERAVVQEETIDSIPLITTEVSEGQDDDATIESSAQPENENSKEIAVEQVADTTVEATNEMSQERTESSTVGQDEIVDSVSLTSIALDEIRQVNDTTVDSIPQSENELLGEHVLGQASNTTVESTAESENQISENVVLEKVDDSMIIPTEVLILQESVNDTTIVQEEAIDSIPLIITEVLEKQDDESSAQPESENAKDIVLEKVDDTTVIHENAVESVGIMIEEQIDGSTVGQEETVDSIPAVTAIAVEEEIVDNTIAQPDNKILEEHASDTIVESNAQTENKISDHIFMEQVDDSMIVQEEVIAITNTIFQEQANDTTVVEEAIDSFPLITSEVSEKQDDDATIESSAQPEKEMYVEPVDDTTVLQENIGPTRTVQEDIIHSIPLTAIAGDEEIVEQIDDTTVESIAQPESQILDHIVMEQVDDSMVIQEEVIETVPSHINQTNEEVATEQVTEEVTQNQAALIVQEESVEYPPTTTEVFEQIILEQVDDTMVVQEVVLEPVVCNINDICEEIVMEQIDETMLQEEIVDNLLQNEISEDEDAREKCSLDDSAVFENSLVTGSEKSDRSPSHEESTRDELIKMGDDVGIDCSSPDEVHVSDVYDNQYQYQPDEIQASEIDNSSSASPLQVNPTTVTAIFEGPGSNGTNGDKQDEALDKSNAKNLIFHEETFLPNSIIEMKDSDNNEINQFDATTTLPEQQDQPTEAFSRNLYVLANAASGHFTNNQDHQLQPNFASENEIKQSENVEEPTTELLINEASAVPSTIEPVLDEHISDDYVHEETVVTEPGEIFTEQNCSNNLVVLAAAAAKRKKVESPNFKSQRKNNRGRKKNNKKEVLERSIPRRVTRSATVSKLTIDVQDNSKCIPSTFMNLENLVTPPPICVYNFIPSIVDEESIDEPFSSVKNLQEILARNVAYDEDTLDDNITLVNHVKEVDSEVIISIPESEKDFPGINYEILNQTEEFAANTNLSLSTSEELCKELKLTMTKNNDAVSADFLEISNLSNVNLNQVSLLGSPKTEISRKPKSSKQKKKSLVDKTTDPMPIKKRRNYGKEPIGLDSSNDKDIPSLIENETAKTSTVQVLAENVITEEPEIKFERPFPTKASLKCFQLSNVTCNPYVQLQKLPVNCNIRGKSQEKIKSQERKTLYETKPKTSEPKQLKTRRITLDCLPDEENNKNRHLLEKIDDRNVTRRRKSSQFSNEMLTGLNDGLESNNNRNRLKNVTTRRKSSKFSFEMVGLTNGLEIEEILEKEELTVKPKTRSHGDKCDGNVQEISVMRTRSKMRTNDNTTRNSVTIIEKNAAVEHKNVSTPFENEALQDAILENEEASKNLKVHSHLVKNKSKKRSKKYEALNEKESTSLPIEEKSVNLDVKLAVKTTANKSIDLVNQLLSNKICDQTKCELNSDKVETAPNVDKVSEIVEEKLSGKKSYCELETKSLEMVGNTRDICVADSEVTKEISDSLNSRNLETDVEKCEECELKNVEIPGFEDSVLCLDESSKPKQPDTEEIGTDAENQSIAPVKGNDCDLDENKICLADTDNVKNNEKDADQTEEKKELRSNSTNHLQKYINSRSRRTKKRIVQEGKKRKSKCRKYNSNICSKKGRGRKVSFKKLKTLDTKKLEVECDETKSKEMVSNATKDLEVNNSNPEIDSAVISEVVTEEIPTVFLENKEIVQCETLDVNENSFLHKQDVSLIPLPDEEPPTKSETSFITLNTKIVETSTSDTTLSGVLEPIVELENSFTTANDDAPQTNEALLVEKVDEKSVENNLLCTDNEIDSMINTDDHENQTPTEECVEETTTSCQNTTENPKDEVSDIILEKHTEESMDSDNVSLVKNNAFVEAIDLENIETGNNREGLICDTSDRHVEKETSNLHQFDESDQTESINTDLLLLVPKKDDCEPEEKSCANNWKEEEEMQFTNSSIDLVVVREEAILACENVLDATSLPTIDDSMMREKTQWFEEKFGSKIRIERRHSISTETCDVIQQINSNRSNKQILEKYNIECSTMKKVFKRNQTTNEKIALSVSESSAVVLSEPEIIDKDTVKTEPLTDSFTEHKQLSDDDEIVLVNVEQLSQDEIKLRDTDEYAYDSEPTVEKIFEKYSKKHKNKPESEKKIIKEKRVRFNPEKNTVKIIDEDDEDGNNVPSSSKKPKIEDESTKHRDKQEKNKHTDKKDRHSKSEKKLKERKRENSKKIDVLEKIEKTDRELKSLKKVESKRDNSTSEKESRKRKRDRESNSSSKTVPESSKKIKHAEIGRDKQMSKKSDEKQESYSKKSEKKRAKSKHSESVQKHDGIVADKDENILKEQHHQELSTQKSSKSVNKEGPEITKQIENDDSCKENIREEIIASTTEEIKIDEVFLIMSKKSEQKHERRSKKSEKKCAKPKQSESVEKLDGIVADKHENAPKEQSHQELLTQNVTKSVNKEESEITTHIEKDDSSKNNIREEEIIAEEIKLDEVLLVPKGKQTSKKTEKKQETQKDQSRSKKSEKKRSKPKQSESVEKLDGTVAANDETVTKEQQNSSKYVNEITKQIENDDSSKDNVREEEIIAATSEEVKVDEVLLIVKDKQTSKKADTKQVTQKSEWRSKKSDKKSTKSRQSDKFDEIGADNDKEQHHHQEPLTQNSPEGSEISEQFEKNELSEENIREEIVAATGEEIKVDEVLLIVKDKQTSKKTDKKQVTQKSEWRSKKSDKKSTKPRQSDKFDRIVADNDKEQHHHQEHLAQNSSEGSEISEQIEKNELSEENIREEIVAATGEEIKVDEVFLNEEKPTLNLEENDASPQINDGESVLPKEAEVVEEVPTECHNKNETGHIIEEQNDDYIKSEEPIKDQVGESTDFKKPPSTKRKECKRIDAIIENLKNKNYIKDDEDSFMTLMVDDKIDHEEHVESTIRPDNCLVEADEQNPVVDGIVQNDVNKTFFPEFDLDQSKFINTEVAQCEDMFPYIQDSKKDNCLLEIDSNEITTSLADNTVSLLDVNKQVDAAEASTSCEMSDNLIAVMFSEQNRSNKTGFIFFKGSDHNYHSMGDPLLGGECDSNESDHSTDNKEIPSPELENVLVNDTILPYISTLTDNHQESSEDSGADFQLLELIGNTLARESSPPLTQSINCDNLEYDSAPNGVDFSKINNEVFTNQYQQPTMSVENMSELMNVITSLQNLNNMSKRAHAMQQDANRETLFSSSDFCLNEVVQPSQPTNLDLSCDFSQAHTPDVSSECTSSNTPILETDYSNLHFIPLPSGNISVVEELPAKKVIVEHIPQYIEHSVKEIQPVEVIVEKQPPPIKLISRPKISEAIALAKQNNMSLSKKALDNIGFIRNSSKTKPSAPKQKKNSDQKKEYKKEKTPEIEYTHIAKINDVHSEAVTPKNCTSSPPKEKSLPIIEDLMPTLKKPEVKVNKAKEDEKSKQSPAHSKCPRTPRQTDQKLDVGETYSQSDMIDNVKRRKRKPVDYSSIEKLLENDEYDYPKSQKSKTKKDDKIKGKQKEEEIKIKKTRVADDAVPSTSNSDQTIPLKMRSSIFEDSDDDIPKKKRSKPEPRSEADVLFDRLVKEGDVNKEKKGNTPKVNQDPQRPPAANNIFSVEKKIETTPVKQIGVVNPIPRQSNHVRREVPPSRSSYSVEESRTSSQYYPYYAERSRRSYPYSSREGRDSRPSSHQGSSRRTEYSTHSNDQRYSSQRSSSSSRSSRSNRHHSNSRSNTEQRDYWFGAGNDLSWREDMKRKFPNVFKDEFF